MATATQQQETHWRDRYIAKATIISDSWQVALAWLGRFAEIILFVSMILMLANIVIPFPSWFVGGVLVVQMITLDIAAFGLETMANHVKRNGNEEAAQNAETMSKALIAVMIITAVNVVVALRFGSEYQQVKTFTGYIDDALIFVRIIAVILYGKTIRSLREVSQAIETAKQDETEALKDQIGQLQQTIHSEQQRTLDLQADLQTARNQAAMTLQTAGSQNDLVNDLQNRLQEALQQVRDLSAKLDQKQRDLDLQTAKLQTATTDLQTAKSQVSDLQNRLQEAKLQTTKSPAGPSAKNVTSIDQARAKHEAAGNGKAKVSDNEIFAFRTANPNMTASDVANHFGISVSKVNHAKPANLQKTEGTGN